MSMNPCRSFDKTALFDLSKASIIATYMTTGDKNAADTPNSPQSTLCMLLQSASPLSQVTNIKNIPIMNKTVDHILFLCKRLASLTAFVVFLEAELLFFVVVFCGIYVHPPR